MRRINQVAVLGAGVMGATIAAHLANAGLEVLLLDIVPGQLTDKEQQQGLALDQPQVRNRVALSGRDALLKMKPAPLYLPHYLERIRAGNLEDDLAQLENCDWIIEAVIENLAIKKQLFEKLTPHLGQTTVLSSNTSGLSIDDMAQALPPECRRRFLITHFFNPPRYMRLLEIVAGKETDPQVLTEMADFIRKRLGKGIVYAKDTPNFIANRIGVFSIFNGIKHMMEMGLTVEEVDAVAGPATARPKSAAFRTIDLVGIDTLAHIGKNSYELLPDDEQRETFSVPEFMQQMIDTGLLGNKSKAGFYKKQQEGEQKNIFYYDYREHQFKPLQKPRFPSLAAVKMVDDPARKVKMVVEGQDKAGQYAWKTLRDTLIYTVNRIPEIADDVVNIDNAMKWGFNWEIGPFEMFDAIGVSSFVHRARQDGVQVPAILDQVPSFYRFTDNGQKEYFDLGSLSYRSYPLTPGQIQLQIRKKAGGVVENNADCSLIDIGDGVFCFEFHSKMNTISGDILSMTQKAIDRTRQDGVGLVIGNQGANFSVGANLMLLAGAMAEDAFEDIDRMVRAFQKATMAVKYADIPVVAAPFGMCLGGGCEYALHADAINAYAETYMGLVEIGVGLLPAGGGTKEMCLRAVRLAGHGAIDPSPYIFKYFKQIGMATLSTGAAELDDLGYLRQGDSISMDLDRLIADAKQKVLGLAVNYRPQKSLENIPAPGRNIAASIKTSLRNMQQGGFITPYEEQMGGVIAEVICGGDVAAGTLISEDYLLQLERQAFLKLCGNRKTAERIQHMLQKGKPLRN